MESNKMKTIFNESENGLETFLTIENCPQELQNMLESAGFVCCDNGNFVLSGSTLDEAKTLYKQTAKAYKTLCNPVITCRYYYPTINAPEYGSECDEPLSLIGNELINE